MGYLLATAITLNRSSTFIPLMRYFSSRKQIINLKSKWWRPGTVESATNDIRRYNIIFSEEFVKDLKYKLRNSKILMTPLADKIVNYDESRINMDILSKLLYHWAYNYNFKEREKSINSYPHFMTNIQGLDIHFIHVKRCNVEKRRIPLLLLHGWPSSIMEFYKKIPFKFAKEREMIIPSLPGFGFSSAPTISGFSCIEMSVVLKNLMLRLGHDKFRVKGGIYGAIIGRVMSILFPQYVINDDLNMRELYDYMEKTFFWELNEKRISIEQILKEMALFHIQATEINTIAIGLNDSPAALAAYFIEKTLSDTVHLKSVRKEYVMMKSYTEMIDNLMMYWAPQCINTAMRVYVEQFNNLPNEFIELLKNQPLKVFSNFSQYFCKGLSPLMALKKIVPESLGRYQGRFLYTSK